MESCSLWCRMGCLPVVDLVVYMQSSLYTSLLIIVMLQIIFFHSDLVRLWLILMMSQGLPANCWFGYLCMTKLVFPLILIHCGVVSAANSAGLYDLFSITNYELFRNGSVKTSLEDFTYLWVLRTVENLCRHYYYNY